MRLESKHLVRLQFRIVVVVLVERCLEPMRSLGIGINIRIEHGRVRSLAKKNDHAAQFGRGTKQNRHSFSFRIKLVDSEDFPGFQAEGFCVHQVFFRFVCSNPNGSGRIIRYERFWTNASIPQTTHYLFVAQDRWVLALQGDSGRIATNNLKSKRFGSFRYESVFVGTLRLVRKTGRSSVLALVGRSDARATTRTTGLGFQAGSTDAPVTEIERKFGHRFFQDGLQGIGGGGTQIGCSAAPLATLKELFLYPGGSVRADGFRFLDVVTVV
mmetsp:Transcript_11965/g.23764  ORF Transcript_11965/g.23764 Transcript_11965/m.23764 type:complete len:270 (+) Transcript_11965:4423-5232(+)